MKSKQGRKDLRTQSGQKSQSGQELVEMAILLPLLLLFLFGVLDLGRIFHAAITITNAAREGARYATKYPDDIPAIVTATRNEAENSGIDMSSSTIDVSCPIACGHGLPVRVTVQYDFEFIMVGFVFPDSTLSIVRSAEMLTP